MEDVTRSYDPVAEAYRILVAAMNKDDRELSVAVEEAVGFLGEALAG